jgi:hypothetical protein
MPDRRTQTIRADEIVSHISDWAKRNSRLRDQRPVSLEGRTPAVPENSSLPRWPLLARVPSDDVACSNSASPVVVISTDKSQLGLWLNCNGAKAPSNTTEFVTTGAFQLATVCAHSATDA